MSAGGYPQISDADELLYRQIHPTCAPDGKVGSNGFDPHRTREPDKLSVARSTLTNPADAFATHIRQGKKSAGTWAVSVAECAAIGLAVHSDPTDEDPAHAFISFAGFSKDKSKEVAQLLKAAAIKRGPLFLPPPTSN